MPNTGFVVQGDQRNLEANRAVSDFDRTHRFSLNFVYQIPTFGSTSRCVEGWQLSGFFQAQTGTPYSIFAPEPELQTAPQYADLVRGSGGELIYQGKGDILVNRRRRRDIFRNIAATSSPPAQNARPGQTRHRSHGTGRRIDGQSDALRHGISRALALAEEGLKITLKRGGLLTRDARSKERKNWV